MNITSSYHQFCQQLETLYPPREARSIARIVFEDAFQIYNPNRQGELEPKQLEWLSQIQRRLLDREPIQYILGQADFYGLKLKVDQRVLIPRQETEELVHWIIEEYAGQAPELLIDIGCGSGCIPISLKRKWPEMKAYAADVSKEALALAEENAQLNQTDIDFLHFDILQSSQWPTLPLLNTIVSNPPYIPFAEADLMPPQVLEFEPSIALFVSNGDPLIFYRRIAEYAQQQLKPNGQLFFETNEFNAKEVIQLLNEMGFSECLLKEDMQGKERMIRAKR